MTPKEKAKELLNKMSLPEHIYIGSARYSALVAVDEILKLIRYHGKDIGEDYSLKRWKEIKQELEKL